MVMALAAFVVVIDTRLKAATHSARTTRVHLMHAIESVAEGFCFFDAQDRLVLCNRKYCELLNRTEEDMLGETFEDIIREFIERIPIPGATANPEEWIRQKLARHRNPSGPYAQERNNGGWLQIDERKTEDGGTVAVYTDVTPLKEVERKLQAAHDDLDRRVRERTKDLEDANAALKAGIEERRAAEEREKKLEAKLQQAQKLESLGVLAGGIAHDFNNLLMGVLGNAEIAQLELAPESPAQERIKNITATALRAAELTKQMPAYSGKGKFVVQALNLSTLVEEMAHLIRVSISRKVVLQCNCANNLPTIEADATQIRQVVMNLIINAAEAIGEESGVVSVSTGLIEASRSYFIDAYLDENLPEGYYVSLEVTDTGCGMDEATRQKIFDPFFTTKFVGRGLGLAALLGIVRGHHGAVKIDSEPGRGTTFEVLFPASAQVYEESADRTDAESSWRGSGVVLVVDDEETVRTAAKMMLESQGFTVLTVEGGREALEVFRDRADEIVVVLLDLTMPHLDGEATFRELRRMRPDTKVILSSGYNEQENTNRFAGKGLAGFIQKPYGIRSLSEKIRRVLEPRSARASSDLT